MTNAMAGGEPPRTSTSGDAVDAFARRGRGILFAVASIATTLYLGYRATTLNPDAPLFSAVFLSAEVYAFGSFLVFAFCAWWRSPVLVRPAPPGRTVDVFIPTIDEPLDVLRRTMLAAVRMDYPHRTVVLDDGRRMAVRALADELGCDYLARSDNADAKAGNLNHGLAHSRAEFIAVIDADHVAERAFLARTLGHLADPAVAFVQTRQDYINTDSFQHSTGDRGRSAWSEQSLFYRVILHGRDRWNAAMFCGCSAVIRRDALDAVGGFATGTVTEDFHTSLRLHKAGFRSIYHDEALAYGLAPANFGQFLRQRMRWGRGAMQVLRGERFLASPGLSLAQKLHYMLGMTVYLDGLRYMVMYLTPALTLLFGVAPFVAAPSILLPLFLAHFVFSVWAFEELSRGFARVAASEHFNMARAPLYLLVLASLPLRRARFRVTSKSTSEIATLTPLLPQIAILLLCLAAFARGADLLLAGALRAVPLRPWEIGFSMIWDAVNAALAAAVIAKSVRLGAGRPARHRIAATLPVGLSAPPGAGTFRAAGHSQWLSADGMGVEIAVAAAEPAPGPTTGVLDLPDGPLAFAGRILAVDRHAGRLVAEVEFEWSGTHGRDRLDVAIFSGGWQAAMARGPARVRPPLERFASWIHGDRGSILPVVEARKRRERG